MEQPKNEYRDIQDRLITGIIKIVRESTEADWFRISRDHLVKRQEIDTMRIHPETLRSLCHYASVAAGEETGTAISYDDNVEYELADGRSGSGIFTVRIERAKPLRLKRGMTYEPRPAETRSHAGHTTINTAVERRKNRIPDHVSRLTKRVGGF